MPPAQLETNTAMRSAHSIVFSALLFFTSAAVASDYVIMKNGDRITGKVKKLWNEEIFIEPVYGDTYAIELEHVAYIHTDEEFEVEFVRGRRTEMVLGRLGLGEDGKPVVIVEDGARTYPLREVDNMLEIEEFFDWEVRSDISVNVASGNTQTNSGRFYAQGNMKLGEHRHKLELTRDGAKADGEVTKDQTNVYYEDLWTFSKDWFMRGSITWTRDPIRDLDSRSQYYVGPGFHFWDDSKRTLNLSLGPNVIVEKIGEESEQSVSIQSVFRYEQRFLNDDLVLFQQTDIQGVVSGRDNSILNTSTGLRWDLPRDIYVNLQVDFDYESNPAEGRQKEDITYLVGVGMELD
jgi:putative salt-induced outer membrane protein YdiY